MSFDIFLLLVLAACHKYTGVHILIQLTTAVLHHFVLSAEGSTAKLQSSLYTSAKGATACAHNAFAQHDGTKCSTACAHNAFAQHDGTM